MGRSCSQNGKQQESFQNFNWKIRECRKVYTQMENNIRMNLTEVGIEMMNWIQLAKVPATLCGEC